MLKITRIDDAHDQTRLRLEGRLTQLEIRALEDACAQLREDHRSLVIDLAGVRFADDAGTAALRRLREHDARLDNATAFLSELLQEEGI